MNYRKDFFVATGIITAVLIIYKAVLIKVGMHYVFPFQAENMLIYTGIAMLAGETVQTLENNGCLKNYCVYAVEAGALLSGVTGYLISACCVPPRETQEAAIVWLSAIISVSVFFITFLVMKKYPVYINRAILGGVRLKREIDEEKAEYRESGSGSPPVRNMRLLREYEYLGRGLDLWDKEMPEEDKTERIYTVEYEGEKAGYFAVRTKEGGLREITEFYASRQIDKSLQILNAAMKKYLKASGKCRVKMTNVGALPDDISYTAEVMVRGFTGACYELVGKEGEDGRLNYDICFVVN